MGVQGGVNAVGVGGVEALVEGECLVQAGEAVVGLSLVQVAVSEAFLGAGFVQGCVQGSGDVEGVLMVGSSISLSATDGLSMIQVQTRPLAHWRRSS